MKDPKEDTDTTIDNDSNVEGLSRPSIESLKDELGRQKKALEFRWNSLVKIENYDRPKELGDLKKLGERGLFPTVKLAYRDIQDTSDTKQFSGEIHFYLKEGKEKNLTEFVDILFSQLKKK